MKSLQEFITEGAWGYEPDQNDGTLDLRGDIFGAICELIYDKCNESFSKKEHKNSKFSTDYAWEALGCVEYFFENITKMEDFGLHGDNDFNKYYYWFRLMEKKKSKNIIELYEKLLNVCKKDEKWIQGWREPNSMLESLKKREEILEHYKSLYENKKQYDKERKSLENDCKQVKTGFIQGETPEEQINFTQMK